MVTTDLATTEKTTLGLETVTHTATILIPEELQCAYLTKASKAAYSPMEKLLI